MRNAPNLSLRNVTRWPPGVKCPPGWGLDPSVVELCNGRRCRAGVRVDRLFVPGSAVKKILAAGLVFLSWHSLARAAAPLPGFRAGAAAVDVSPTTFPVLVNGGFLEAKADRVLDPLYSRSLVLDDGKTRLAIVVVESCMMPRELLDRAKAIAYQKTGLPADHILISATHTHSAPASMGALGCAVDSGYAAALPGKIAASIEHAVANLQPARVGWGSIDDSDDTHCRRWIRQPDKPVIDPFGRPSARAHMHPGHENPDVIGPSGPIDPQLSVLAVKSLSGEPIALLANYSMHYFGATPIAADYFGRFARTIGPLIGVQEGKPFVAMMSQGTSGDQQWMDYAAPAEKVTIAEYSDRVAAKAAAAIARIVFHDHVPLAMAETTLRLKRRIPDENRLAWARAIVAKMGGNVPATLPEVYAKEALYLHDEPERELKLQAIRIGELGIAAIPNEVYALTGLKIKARSPLAATFIIELANGSEGYIPPPEQHALGGYTTWPARTAALDVQAEPKIVEELIGLLSKVAGQPAKTVEVVQTPYASAILRANPWAFWRMEEMAGARLQDATGHGHVAVLIEGFALYLDGVEVSGSTPGRALNHSVHLIGGAVRVDDVPASRRSTITLAFWSGRSTKGRPSRVLLDRGGSNGLVLIEGDRLTVSDKFTNRHVAGRTNLEPKRWYQLAVVGRGDQVQIYLDGKLDGEGEWVGPATQGGTLFVGGEPNSSTSFAGKIDELAIFDRALSAAEVSALHDVLHR